MARNSIREYSSTPASNTDIAGTGTLGINDVRNFDDALRTLMAHLADMNAGTSPIDDTFSICDPADATKKFRIDVGSITTATTRVMTMPDANVTISAYGATLVDDADAATARTTLGLGTAAVKNVGGAIGNVLSLVDYAVSTPIATVYTDDKVIWKKTNTGLADGWDLRVFRDTTGLSGGTPGFVNAALIVETTAASGNAAFEWNALFKLNNYSTAGENTGLYVSSRKYAQGSTWGATFETIEEFGATYGALVGIENAITANGDDTSNIRVAMDIIVARGDNTQAVPTAYAGVRIGAAWNGDVPGVESAKIKRPLLIDANWTDVAVFANHSGGIASLINSKVNLFQFDVINGGNLDTAKLYLEKTSEGALWTNTALYIDRVIDTSTVVGRLGFLEDRSVYLGGGPGATGITIINGGGIVIPSYSVDPSSTVNGQLYFNTTTSQVRVRTSGGWATFAYAV